MTFDSDEDIQLVRELLKTHFSEDAEVRKAFMHFRHGCGGNTFSINPMPLLEDRNTNMQSRIHVKYSTSSGKQANAYTLYLVPGDEAVWLKRAILATFDDSATSAWGKNHPNHKKVSDDFKRELSFTDEHQGFAEDEDFDLERALYESLKDAPVPPDNEYTRADSPDPTGENKGKGVEAGWRRGG
jgi:hypothetical protein